MYRQSHRNCLLILGLASVSLLSTTVSAQEHLIDGAKEEAARVIKLRNRIEVEAEEAVEEVSSRSTRLATNPLANLKKIRNDVSARMASGPQVTFDEIGSQQPLEQVTEKSSYSAPVVSMPNGVSSFKPAPNVYQKQRPTPATPASYAKTVEPRNSTPVSAPIRRSESAPFVTTTISAPEFINVNHDVPVRIDVRNPGETDVYNVKLVATVPPHVTATSRQAHIKNGNCTFQIDTLKAGENRQLIMNVAAKQKQALVIDTALTVSNRNRVSVGVRQPRLVVSVSGPSQTNIGSKATHEITVTNTGDGVASKVNLVSDIPESLHIIQKSGFETPETLGPGQSAKAIIVSVPHVPGETALAFAAEGISCKAEPAQADLRITQPELRVAALGPDMNFIERDGIYSITVDNPGEVDVNNVEVQFVIPENVKVTTISRQAKMDGPNRTLTWNFDRIKAQSEQTIQLKAVASSEGDKFCRIRVASDETTGKEVVLKTLIATRAALSIQMENIGGPVQVGTEATFVVIVENRGSSIANDMEIEVQLPQGMRPASPRDGVVDEDANSILFADSQLSPGKTREFKFSAIGVQKGEHIVRSSLESVGSKQRIMVENSVFVYEPTQARVSEKLQPAIPRR